ncbi:MAG TPA: type II toxin-antitoxin system HicA family toxin [Chloroflexota bacterium]|jgi:predicted RNA binding protein YcfA (HicA-like mRNA interferase family)
MPRLGPVKRDDLIRYFQQLGFDEPRYSGHAFMRGRGRKVKIPNPHEGGISAGLLRHILRQASITHSEWEALYGSISATAISAI